MTSTMGHPCVRLREPFLSAHDSGGGGGIEYLPLACILKQFEHIRFASFDMFMLALWMFC